jgi:hypothetical protein
MRHAQVEVVQHSVTLIDVPAFDGLPIGVAARWVGWVLLFRSTPTTLLLLLCGVFVWGFCLGLWSGPAVCKLVTAVCKRSAVGLFTYQVA